MERHRVERQTSLLEALEAMYAGRSRRDLRELVRDGRVRVDGREQSLADLRAVVRGGALVECARFGRPQSIHGQVRLVHEDDDILVVEKDVGILTEPSGVGARGARVPTVASVLTEHLRRRGSSRSAHPCHRLDRDVSGLLAFATSARVAASVRDDPRHHLAERVYLALVEGCPEPFEGTIESFLADGDDQVVRETAADAGKLARCRYRVLASNARHALVEVRLETGRKNQIRAQLAAQGWPIAGDRKYGARGDPLGRIGLHARSLVLVHPVSRARLAFESPAPFGLDGRVATQTGRAPPGARRRAR